MLDFKYGTKAYSIALGHPRPIVLTVTTIYGMCRWLAKIKQQNNNFQEGVAGAIY